jgi:hypothetical protein
MSKFLSLNWRDFVKGSVLAFITAFVTSFTAILDGGNFPKTKEEWVRILVISLTSWVSYLLKNLVTNTNGELLKKD